MKIVTVLLPYLVLVFFLSCKGQNKTELSNDVKSDNKAVILSNAPSRIVRNVKQDRKGNIWMASWDGVFKYDGKSFTNITTGVSSARFFSLLEDRKGNFWFGTIGSGVFYYDGISFQNFTIKDGLINNEVTDIYEDKAGNIWFGGSGGASLYAARLNDSVGQGKSFRNYVMSGETMNEDRTGKSFSERQPYEVNSIIEDRTGKFWFATRGNTFIYDPHPSNEQVKTFTIFTHDGKPFRNVRCIIEDRRGNIWLGGNDGLWRYDGKTFTNFTEQFIGYIYEDKNGNILTSSGNIKGQQGWALSRYDKMSLTNNYSISVPETIKGNEGMIFGILEADDGSIWFGSGNGVNRYDGSAIDDFKLKMR
jgi:ligand-binding sensor domain-containing protein